MESSKNKKRPGCACGAGFFQTSKGFSIVPHAMNCKVLAKIAETERSGICYSCKVQKVRERGFDPDMGMIVTEMRCPQCGSCDMNWLPPTKADMMEFGLKRVRAR